MTNLSRQAIVGDIGHTNIRFAVADIDELTISSYAYLSTAMFSGPGEALAAYLRSIPERPSAISIAIAGPVEGETARLGGTEWAFTADDIRSVIDARVRLVNDFEALAMLLPHLVEHDIHSIGGGEAKAEGPCVVLGPGTSLEVAALLPTSNGALALSGQGGSMSFACHDQTELALVQAMRPGQSFIAAADVISSRGLVDLDRVLGKQVIRGHLGAADILKAALVHQDRTAQDALRQFSAWLGSFAGDVALLYGATGGVYIAGGMAPPLLEILRAGAFRSAFEAKGAASSTLANIPVHVITAPDACLRGAALAASAGFGADDRPGLASAA